MKRLTFKTLFLTLALFSLTFVSCSDDDDGGGNNNNNNNGNGNGNSDQTIAELAIANDQTDSLVVALTQADLVDLFSNPGTFTVFAPTNEAFRSFLDAGNFTSISDIPTDVLTGVLQYHVLGSVVKSTDLNDDSYGTTLNENGPNETANVIEFDVSGGVKLNNSASVLTPDMMASNGVVHLIDEVITPRKVVDLAINDERFSSLVEALTVREFGLINVLSQNGPFTIFAPTNAAFDALLNSNNNWNQLSDIDSTQLRSILVYHVINARNLQAAELTQGQKLQTIQGADLTVDLSNGAQLQTSNQAQSNNVNILVTDVQGMNGVIHAVDEVLLP